ncbi:tRNA1(Val) (adenine(37)-N6)-methyltransferase [Vibrio maritimus]|uniref:tRNA1(Val) (adenine(37)-N6)-methyltransferase n=1 Tax=Vibrio maritimus TaxID=990268 RepID=UPI0037370146
MTCSTTKTKGFQFKQFSIHDGNSGMPVSTDGVLLGAWARFHSSDTLLDIGTGTGLLTLMLAQRFIDAAITAVDIDETAIVDATYNIRQSPWQKRITVLHSDILAQPFEHTFDGIICNPPYFNSGETAKNSQRATARHTHSLSHEHLLDRCDKLLSKEGSASFVLPKVEGEQFISLAKHKGWHLNRICYVQATINKPCNRLLFTLTKRSEACDEERLIIHSASGGYSEDFIALTKDFYLKM